MNDEARAFSERRRIARGGDNRPRQFCKDYEYVGDAGEIAVCLYLGCEFNRTISQPGGDGGIDTWIKIRGKWYGVQVKCSRRAKHLICEPDKMIKSAIYIQCRYEESEDVAYCCGWHWGRILAAAPVWDVCGTGVQHHGLPVSKCRRMIELKDLVNDRNF